MLLLQPHSLAILLSHDVCISSLPPDSLLIVSAASLPLLLGSLPRERVLHARPLSVDCASRPKCRDPSPWLLQLCPLAVALSGLDRLLHPHSSNLSACPEFQSKALRLIAAPWPLPAIWAIRRSVFRSSNIASRCSALCAMRVTSSAKTTQDMCWSPTPLPSRHRYA